MDEAESSFHLLTLILSESQCHKCAQLAKQFGLHQGIIVFGKGTVATSWLHLLGISSQKREIVQFLIPADESRKLLNQFAVHLQLDSPGHGIAYLSEVELPDKEGSTQKQKDHYMVKKITVIVDRGLAEDVVDAAKEAGVTGGTIIHGRGTGSEIESRLFGVEIEPEKELIMMLLPQELAFSVIEVLTKTFNLGSPGKGILYVEPILETRGLFQQ